MKKHLFLFGAAMFVCGAMMLTSCSKDEDVLDNNQKSQPVMSSNPYQTFNMAYAEVQKNLQQCDFHELQPLANALQNNTAKVAKAGGIDEKISNEFLSRLSDLVWNFLRLPSEENPLTLSGSYTNSKESISLAWALSAFVIRNEYLFGVTNENKVSVDVVVNDTTVYTIIFTNDNNIARYKVFSDLGGYSINEVAIMQGEEQIASVGFAAYADYDYSIKNLGLSCSGVVSYKTHEFFVLVDNYEDVNSDMHIWLTYVNNGSPMAELNTVVSSTGSLLKPNANTTFYLNLMDSVAVISGTMSDLSGVAKLFASSVSLLTNGGTKQQCDEFVNTLNSKLFVNVNVAGSDQGIIYAGSELVEGSDDTYRPTMILKFAMFDNEPMTLSELLAAFGISIDDLKGKLPVRK